ncbi:hypothetical protein NitYY0826_P34 (plasmid) [Nitratiruptor sp. YY08-26]|uniref:hypothetical protein n=1 Tax=unclassified Nitratiruptor TaxID=2624044 RepID=UPI001915802E|nr:MULTISPECIES: hypothetical protein [unclassified Nitratiruptor]BCD63193.1 hypothetical protein NitYY0813_P34 [Nitratiruptor sp. YY08-13]BCD67129.1 hypothetical protein NitYY0826_P34 [Nitratiruptor sp. YY08-26]
MTLKRLMLSGVAALSILGSSAFAADNSGAVNIATDGTGDYLVFPYYAATTAGNWKTNIRVVNTNPTQSIVAKVVIREWKTSAEKLDFPIYLTPGDVWEATLETDSNGNVVLVCNDDSMIVKGVPASVTPQRVPLFPAEGLQDNHYGYIEVFGVGQIAASAVPDMDNDGNTWALNRPQDKDDLYAYYKATLNNGVNPGNIWSGVDTTSMYGQEILFAKNQYGNLAMTLPATALEGVTGSKANTKRVIAADTKAGNVIIPDAGQTVTGVLLKVSEALRKTHLYATYYDNGQGGVADTVLLLTQPMKKYLHPTTPLNNSPIGYSFDNSKDGDASTVSLMDYYLKYSTVARDMEEHTNIQTTEFSGGKQIVRTCNTEICIWDVASYTGSFTNGYVDFDLTGNKTWFNKRKGIHGIPTLMTAKNVSGTNVTNVIKPAYSK